MTEDRLLNSLETRQYLGGISRATLDRWTARGLIPRPVAISRMRFWRLSELNAMADALAAARNPPEAPGEQGRGPW